jgi:hypothetical protein
LGAAGGAGLESAPGARAARGVALHDLGREAAQTALAGERAEVSAVVAHLLRSSASLNAATLAVSARDHLARFSDASESVLDHHPDGRQGQRALSDGVRGRTVLAKALGPTGAAQLAPLLLRRADIPQRQGLPSAALSTLDAVLRLAEPRRGEGQLTDKRPLAKAWLIRCQVLLHEGDLPGGLERAQRSVPVSRSAFLPRDLLRLHLGGASGALTRRTVGSFRS